MRIPSSKTDIQIYFVAVDATDLKTRETGLTGFTVYRSRNGAAAAAYVTPTVTELSAANMPGVYALLIDEDTTVAANSDSEEYVVHITHASMAPVTRTVEIYRRDTTSGRTQTVDANGRVDVGAVVGVAQTAGDIIADTNDLQTTLATINGKLDAIDDFVDTEVSAIKAKTDQLTFGTANRVDAQVFGIENSAITANAIAGNAITAAKIATDAVDADALAADAVTEIQSGLSTLNAAGVRGAVGLAAANLDTQLGTIDDFLDTEVAAIKAKTDNLPSDPADASDIATAFGTVNTTLGTLASYVDTEVAAIKAKTDNLPASPAATGDCITPAGVRGAIGMAAANLDTQLGAIDDFIDTEIGAIKTETDKIPSIKAKTDALPASPAATGDIPTAIQNADALLKRDMSTVVGEASRSPLNALRFIRNRFSTTTTPGSVDVFKEDDATLAYSKSLTTSASADPIVEG